jgi:hypothetical protein
MTHPYKAILNAIADGEQIEFQSHTDGWIKVDASEVLVDIAKELFEPHRYRAQPKTLEVNGYEFPEPFRGLPC